MTTARGGCPLQLGFKVLHLGFGNLPQPGFLLLLVLSFGTQAGLFLPLLLGFLSPFGRRSSW